MRIEEEMQKANVKGVIIGAVISALGFLVALQWNNTIKSTIDIVIPEGEGLIYQYISTIIITAIAVVLAYIIIRVQKIHISNMFRKHKKQQI